MPLHLPLVAPLPIVSNSLQLLPSPVLFANASRRGMRKSKNLACSRSLGSLFALSSILPAKATASEFMIRLIDFPGMMMLCFMRACTTCSTKSVSLTSIAGGSSFSYSPSCEENSATRATLWQCASHACTSCAITPSTSTCMPSWRK